MKTIFKMAFLFAFVAIAGTSMAGGNLKMDIQPISSEKALVAISSFTESNLKITLADEQGNIVYYKEVAEPTGDYKKVYDFSALEAGLYKLSVESDNLTSERVLDIRNWKIEVGQEKTTLEPFFSYDDGLFRYSYLNFPQENLTILFYDKDQVIYTKEIGRNFSVTEALDLSKLEKGEYKAVLLAGNKDFSYPITIN